MEVGSSSATVFEKDRSGPKVFEKTVRDVTNDTWQTARDVGQVRLNYSRLNIFTSLTAGDEKDHFKFNVPSTGPFRIGGWNDDTVRLQLLDHRGRLIADSDPDAGRRAHDAFLRITGPDGEEGFEPGDYIVRVSRLEDDDGEDKPYSLQLQMGDQVRKDYDTTETAAKAESAPVTGVTMPNDPLADAQASPSTLAAQAIGSMLDDNNAHLTNILSGAYNTLFPPVK